MSQYPEMISINESTPTIRDVDDFGCVLVRDVDGVCFIVTLKDESLHNEEGVFTSQHDYFETNKVVEWCSLPPRTT